jgi:hypothetical protein
MTYAIAIGCALVVLGLLYMGLARITARLVREDEEGATDEEG